MQEFTIDKNYNIKLEKDRYDDDLIETIDLIARARTKKTITDTEAALLYKLAVKREFQKEAQALTPFARARPDVYSLFMNMKSKRIRHV